MECPMSRQSNRSGMGSHKHGVSGPAAKSPRLRHAMKRAAESQQRPARASTCTHASIAELMKKGR